VPLYTTDALVLRTYKLAEADRIVVFLTRDRGKKRGVAKGARRTRSRFTGALEPLTEVRVAYFEKEQRELVGLNYAETIRSPLTLAATSGAPTVRITEAPGRQGPDTQREPTDRADALGYLGYFAELLDECAQESDADERLYRLGASMLDALTAGAPSDLLARYFEYWLLRLQGVYPASRVGLSTTAAVFVSELRQTAPRSVGDIAVEREVLKEVETMHRTLIARHLEKTVKSDRVLRDLRRTAG
jgi:DNA repair protein RecO (recombination protein O)